MLELLGLGLGLVLAYAADRYRYGRQLLALAQKGLDVTRGTALDKLPDDVRKVAEAAVIAANQREVQQVAKKLTELQERGKREAADAYERGKRLGEGMQVEIIDRTGDESWSRPFKDK